VRRTTDPWDRTIEVERGQSDVNSVMITISEADENGRCRVARAIVRSYQIRELFAEWLEVMGVK
jgi:hypothetical protein